MDGAPAKRSLWLPFLGMCLFRPMFLTMFLTRGFFWLVLGRGNISPIQTFRGIFGHFVSLTSGTTCCKVTTSQPLICDRFGGWKKKHIPQMVVNKWWFTIAESIRISLTKSKWWFPSSESLLDSNVSAPFSGEKNPSLLRNSPPVNQRRTKLWFRRSFSLIDFQVPAVKIVKSLRNEEKNHLNQTSIFWIPSPLVFGESVNFHVTKHHVTNFPIVFMAQETHLHQRWAEILTPDSKHWKKMFWPIKYDVLDI